MKDLRVWAVWVLSLAGVSCGPSQKTIEAKKGDEAKARLEVALQQVQEASKVPQLTGKDVVIEGWSLGVKGMKEGGVRLLIIPPGLAYGKEGRAGFVGRDKTLWYRIELIKAYDPF